MSWFITGTDTNAGKTDGTSRLVRALRAIGRNAVTMKPLYIGVSAWLMVVSGAFAQTGHPIKHGMESASHVVTATTKTVVHVTARNTARVGRSVVHESAHLLLSPFRFLWRHIWKPWPF